MFNGDSLRPKGSVEVMCSTPGCGNAWWIDPLDPRLPDGPFDCGDDHKVTGLVRRRLSMLRLRHGITVGMLMPLGPPRPAAQDNPCGSASMSSALAAVSDRNRGAKGILEWANVNELADSDQVAERVNWSEERWKEVLGEMGVDPNENTPEGHVRWVGYNVDEKVRRYTFVPCAREGCPHRVMVDVVDPTYQPDSYMIGSWGGGTMPTPKWWGGPFKCEDGLGTSAPNPCALTQSDAIRQYEQTTGSRWTVWYSFTDDQGTVLFWTPRTKHFSLFVYDDPDAFTTASRIAQNTHHGSLSELETYLRTYLRQRREDNWDEVLDELQVHTRLSS